MKLLNAIIIAGVTTLFAVIPAQISDRASSAVNQFAFKFLAELTSQSDETDNIAISPYTIWNVMAIINEGAQGNTAKQLEDVLGIPPNGPDREQFRRLQQALTQNVLKNSEGVTLEIANALFTASQKKLKNDFKQLVHRNYNVDVTPVDFSNKRKATNYINNILANATRGRIKGVIKEDDVSGYTEMIIASALFFKGIWEKKFEVNRNKEQPFYNEKGESIGKVQMMFNEGPFKYTHIFDGKAKIVELPYKDNQMSMIIVLPTKSNQLKTILHQLAETPFTYILDELTKSAEFFDDNTLVYLPKFKVTSHINLNAILYKLGIQDAFDQDVVELTKIISENLILSKVIHKAEIDVDESGTAASSITVAELVNLSVSPDFVANRPFAFLIYDTLTQTIVFMGKYSFPN